MKKSLLLLTLAVGALLCSCGEKKATDNCTAKTECVSAKLTAYDVPYSDTTVNFKENKRVLIVSSSPRRGGNTDLMADAFLRGAQEAGGEVEKIFLADYNLEFLSEEGADNPKESMRETESWQLVEKFLEADVVVLASPVYFMNVNDRMKTFIDLTYLGYGDERMGNKEFYYITACADNEEATAEDTFFAMRGFAYCLPHATERGYVAAVGVGRKGAVVDTQFIDEAYELGKTINKR